MSSEKGEWGETEEGEDTMKYWALENLIKDILRQHLPFVFVICNVDKKFVNLSIFQLQRLNIAPSDEIKVICLCVCECTCVCVCLSSACVSD